MFDSILGHREVKEKLSAILQQGMLSSSFLFFGPPSVGKRTTALEFARYVLCLGDRGEECDCQSCKNITGDHPDLCVAGQEKIKVDDVERVLEFSAVTPFLSDRKVVVLDNADEITLAAASRLLKVMEEPPEHLCFMLVTSEPHRVIETIRSRCLRVRFGNLSEENVINVIFQKLGFDATQSRILGWIASGSSIDIFPQAGMFLKQRDRAMGFVHRATRGNLIDLLDFIEEFDKEEMGAFVDMLVLLMSDLLLLLNDVDQIVNSDLRKQLTEEMGRFNPKGLLAAVNTLSQVKRYGYLNINLNNSLRNALIKVQPYFKAA